MPRRCGGGIFRSTPSLTVRMRLVVLPTRRAAEWIGVGFSKQKKTTPTGRMSRLGRCSSDRLEPYGFLLWLIQNLTKRSEYSACDPPLTICSSFVVSPSFTDRFIRSDWSDFLFTELRCLRRRQKE